MKLNETEKMIQQQLKKELSIPDSVHDSLQEAYRKIENKEVLQKKPAGGKRWQKRAVKIGGGMAAALAAAFLFCVSHPAEAKDLPWIGHLFERLESKVSFSGDFSGKAEVLEGEELTAFSQAHDGMTVTVSEVYANEMAVYLTLLLKREEPFPELAQAELDPDYPMVRITWRRDYDFMELPEEDRYENQTDLEGEFLDDRTYAGILRIDLESDTSDTTEYYRHFYEMKGTLLAEMGLTDETLDQTSEEKRTEFYDRLMERSYELQKYKTRTDVPEQFHLQLDISRISGISNTQEQEGIILGEGDWSFDIPVCVDTSRTEVRKINEINENGFGLESVIRTPYELTVNIARKRGDYWIEVLDADGKAMPDNHSSNFANNYTIRDRDISTVDIYILDHDSYNEALLHSEWYEENDYVAEGEEWEKLLKEEALYHKTLHFEEADELFKD